MAAGAVLGDFAFAIVEGVGGDGAEWVASGEASPCRRRFPRIQRPVVDADLVDQAIEVFGVEVVAADRQGPSPVGGPVDCGSVLASSPLT